MNDLDTHVCLVSAQATPNLSPYVDPEFAPRRLVLLVSPGMEQRADWLEQALRGRLALERWTIDDPWDLQAIRARLLDCLERESALVDARRIALNATGGTKPMSLAGADVFRAFDLPVYYIHPRHDRVIWLYPHDHPGHDLADRLRIETFVQAHGFSVPEEPGRSIENPARLTVARAIAEDFGRYGRAIGHLNYRLGSGGRKIKNLSRSERRNLDDLIRLFQQHGLLQRRKGRLEFAHHSDRFFAHGGWLEQLTFDLLRRLRKKDPRIHDIAYGLQVERGEVHNELDVVALRDNRFYLIECKTSKLRSQKQTDKAAQVLYKLDSLSDLMGGLQARAMLVSYRPVNPAQRDRARELGIHICAGEEISRLEDHLHRFINP